MIRVSSADRKRFIADQVFAASKDRFSELHGKFVVTDINDTELSITWVVDGDDVHYYRVRVTEAL